jgi:hypothetical protein
MTELPPVYRLHARTSCEDVGAIFEYLLDEQLVAVGWGAGKRVRTWKGYTKVASSDDWYGEVNSSVRAFHDAELGALVWMRDPRGAYYLASIDGPWRYLTGAHTAYLDLWNARPATIKPVAVESLVPARSQTRLSAGRRSATSGMSRQCATRSRCGSASTARSPPTGRPSRTS